MADRGATDDLASLAKLDESTLLQELKSRYTRDKIYTYLGDVLVAVNPFKQLPIYNAEQRRSYHNVPRAQNPPHIFAVASSAYQQMMATGNSQCCVISGESGAGKTESAKLIVTQLIELSRGQSILEQKILQVNPLLEAFGNAATVMNNNSSRFGKYLQLKFKDGRVTGAKINEYLLEKSRVVHQSRLEQNFHVFYCMFAGLDAARKTRLGMENPDKFKYLCQGASCLHTRHEETQQQFEELQNALDLVGFESELQEEIFSCLAAVLHLGNIEFIEDDKEYSHIVDPNSGPLKTAALLVGVDREYLGSLVTINEKVTRGETIRKHLNQQKAAAARDALAKAIYDRIFRWIVNRINQLLAPTVEEMEGEREIGILDIFGFEMFERNSFEQLCINLANEQLQFFFNEHIFAMEQEEYKQEGISATDFKFRDNKPLLDLFLGKPLGLLSLLDEQSNFPQATDTSLVTKFNETFKKKKSVFIASKGSASGTFAIQHYAGKVVYESYGFLEKNRDKLPDGGMELMRTSSVGLAQLIFLATITRTGTLAVGRLANRRTGKLKKRTIGKKGPVPTPRTWTVGSQFKHSLQVLIEKLNRATPHFIRCIKPNSDKVPNKFDDDCVVTQLRYTGMLETIRIRREGYAFRPTFEEFIERYKTIAAEPQMTVSIANCQKIVNVAKLTNFQIGKSRVFLKYWHVDQLNKLMENVQEAVIVIQKVVRGFVQRCKYGVLLATKSDQERRLAHFLVDVPRGGREIFSQQQTLVAEDEKRTQESPLLPMTSMSSSMAAAAEVEESTLRENKRKLAEVAPPDDMLSLPPEPKLIELDDDDDVTVLDEGDSFIAPSRDAQLRKFGREGTKKASARWFRKTQIDRVRNSGGFFHEWLHGVITRRKTEQLLMDKTVGTFLIRVSENRFGYSLSFRVVNRCKHYMISQLETGKYVIVGEPKAHGSLEEMVTFHTKHPLNTEGDLLTVPCGQLHPQQPDFANLLDPRAQSFIPTAPPLADPLLLTRGSTFSLQQQAL